MLDKLVSNDFNEFVNYALTNFTLNMLKRGGYNRKNDERTFFFFFCKVFVLLFKSFANCLGVLNFTW